MVIFIIMKEYYIKFWAELIGGLSELDKKIFLIYDAPILNELLPSVLISFIIINHFGLIILTIPKIIIK